MDCNNRGASVGMPQEMVAAANANHLEADLTQSGDHLPAAKSREPAHVSTSIR
jgi:hypothetical protein